MQKYQNIAGNSGVTEYELGVKSITVMFDEGHCYKYTYASAGKANIEKMKALAVAGRGLSTFISQTVKDRYAAKMEC